MVLFRFRPTSTFLMMSLLMLPGPIGVLAAEGDGALTKATTSHFIVRTERLDAAETGRFLEALYGNLTNFFGQKPDRKLQLTVYAGRGTYEKAMRDLHQVFFVPRQHRGPAGTYLRQTGTSYTYEREDDYETRKIIIHAVASAFDDHLRPWTTQPSTKLCTEGLAEYFALHNWDGKTLQTGIVPPIARFNYARMAHYQFTNDLKSDFQGLVEGRTRRSYPLSWALVRFLIQNHRPQFDQWRQGINHNVDPDLVWNKQFGKVTPAFTRSFTDWLNRQQPPWWVISGAWHPSGSNVVGRAQLDQHGSQALWHDTPKSWKLVVMPKEPPGDESGGLILNWKNLSNYTRLLWRPGKGWEWADVVDDMPVAASRRTIPGDQASPSVGVQSKSDQLILTIGDQKITLDNPKGRQGLIVKTGTMSFKINVATP